MTTHASGKRLAMGRSIIQPLGRSVWRLGGVLGGVAQHQCVSRMVRSWVKVRVISPPWSRWIDTYRCCPRRWSVGRLGTVVRRTP